MSDFECWVCGSVELCDSCKEQVELSNKLREEYEQIQEEARLQINLFCDE